MNTKLFTRKHQMEALKKARLPHSKPTFLKYEALGIIKAGDNSIVYKDRIWRLYTREEIEENVKRVKKYKS